MWLNDGPTKWNFISVRPPRTEKLNTLDVDPRLDVDGRVVWNAHDARVTIQVFVEGYLEDGSPAVPVEVC